MFPHASAFVDLQISGKIEFSFLPRYLAAHKGYNLPSDQKKKALDLKVNDS